MANVARALEVPAVCTQLFELVVGLVGGPLEEPDSVIRIVIGAAAVVLSSFTLVAVFGPASPSFGKEVVGCCDMILLTGRGEGLSMLFGTVLVDRSAIVGMVASARLVLVANSVVMGSAPPDGMPALEIPAKAVGFV